MKYEEKSPTILQQYQIVRRLERTVDTCKKTGAPLVILRTYESALRKARRKLDMSEKRREVARKAARHKYDS